jgi:polar amino acid transport system substrate-binding protein
MTTSQMTRRRFLTRSALLSAIAAAGPTLLSACGSGGGNGAAGGATDGGGQAAADVLAEARQAGYIRVGFANEVPYGYADEAGELTGEAPTVAREVMSRLDVPEIDGVLTEFGSLIPGLEAGRFDIVAAGMFITPERCQQVIFSDPDYCAQQAFLVREGNPLGLTDYEAVAANPQARLGVLTGAVEGDQARAAGVADSQISELADPPSLLEGLLADRIDALGLTTITVNNLLETAGANAGVEATEPFTAVVDGVEQLGCGAFAFRQSDQAFRDAFNDVLNEMKDAGEIVPLVEEFGFAEAAEAANGETAEKHCGMTEGSEGTSAASEAAT